MSLTDCNRILKFNEKVIYNLKNSFENSQSSNKRLKDETNVLKNQKQKALSDLKRLQKKLRVKTKAQEGQTENS